MQNIIGPFHGDTNCTYVQYFVNSTRCVSAHERNCLAGHVPRWCIGTLEASLPRMTARSSPKIIWTVETDVFDQTARVAKEIGDGAAPSLPIQDNAPTSPAISNRTSILEQCSDLAGSAPAPVPARSCYAMCAWPVPPCRPWIAA
jgi:hypothetical protein